MATWVADRAGTKLVSQIDAIAPNRSRASDGTIGDEAHQATDSAHNPEDSADADVPGNPDEQVDAFDVTHDPAHGCDIGVFWEQIRTSRDMRAKFAIFNKRCFSNYAHNGYAAFTWRPYSGDNPHDGHGHIEIDDRYHDQTHDWKIGMSLEPYDQSAIRYTDNRVAAFAQGKDKVEGTPSAPQAKGETVWPVVTLKKIIAILENIEAALADPVPATLTQADREEIARLVVEQLGALQFVPSSVASPSATTAQ